MLESGIVLWQGILVVVLPHLVHVRLHFVFAIHLDISPISDG
jgi:hypothetical protein